MIDSDSGDQLEGIPPAAPAVDQSATSEVEAGVRSTLAAAKSGIVPTPLSGTIRALQEAGVRGQSGMMLLQTVTARLENEIDATRSERETLARQLEDVRRQYYEEREKVSVLRERIRAIERTQWFQAASLAIGGLVGGVAAPHLSDAKPGLAIGGTILSVVLIALGCVPAVRRRED